MSVTTRHLGRRSRATTWTGRVPTRSPRDCATRWALRSTPAAASCGPTTTIAITWGTKFPAEYQGDAFMTYHGSWNRSVPTGAKVVRVRVQNGRPNAVEDFVTGWQLSDGSRWGRPVAVVTAADGALLISDDAGGRIWRVSYGR